MTPEEWRATQQGLHNKATGLPTNTPYGNTPAPGAPAADPPSSTIGSDLYQFGRGALKGATSNVTGLIGAASKYIGTPDAPQAMQDFAKPSDNEGGWEQAGRIGGEYGSLMVDQIIPGLNAAADASLATKLGVDAIKGAIGGMAGTGDPDEGAKAGAATGAGSTLLKTFGGAAVNAIPAPVRGLGKLAATGASVYGAEKLAHDQNRHGAMSGWPAFYVGHSIPSALAALAAIALGLPPGAQGRAGAQLYKDYGSGQ